MSAISQFDFYPDIIAFRCNCDLEHILCEACYIYYEEGNGQNKSK